MNVTPQMLPSFRDTFAAMLRTGDVAVDDRGWALPPMQGKARVMSDTHEFDAKQLAGLRDAELFYVRQDFTALLDEASTGLRESPGWEEMFDAFFREETGAFIFFEKPISLRVGSGAEFLARFLVWTRHGEEFFFRAMGGHDEHGLVPTAHATASLGRCDGHVGLFSRAVVTAALLRQEGLVDTTEETLKLPRSSNPKKRKAQRRSASTPVKVVNLRSSVAQGMADVERAQRTRLHRWIVRGHWRSQAYGPGRELRRRVYIAPHVKGPAGAPLLQREAVYRW